MVIFLFEAIHFQTWIGHYKKWFSSMSPKVLEAGPYIFWFHSHDALHENRASIHVGKQIQDDVNDAKVWLEPEVEIAKPGRSLKMHELSKVLGIVDHHLKFLMEQWHEYHTRID
jgi:hypothetical protein